MERAEFWRLIEQSVEQSDGECELQFDALSVALQKYPAEEILAFHRLMLDYLRRAHTWDLWAAAYAINGGASDDGFEYFRAWLIGQGEEVYSAALENADSLAGVEISGDDGAECEPLLYAPGDAYRAVTGSISPVYSEQDDDDDPDGAAARPSGIAWSESDLPRRVPLLFQKHTALA